MGGRRCQNLMGKVSRKLQKNKLKGSAKALEPSDRFAYIPTVIFVITMRSPPPPPPVCCRDTISRLNLILAERKILPLGSRCCWEALHSLPPCVNKAEAVQLRAGSPSAARPRDLVSPLHRTFLMFLNCAIILMSSEDLREI